MSAKVIMIQGTMSNAGKSLLVAGLCRIFKQDGYHPAPFKSQNMALNSFITSQGLEMGRAQVMQAEAAGIAPCVSMNPILLKPTNDTGSQVIVNGQVLGNMKARDYFAYKKSLLPQIRCAFDKLSADHDIIVIEGAGSPAEINLKENDIVNMGLAELVDAPVLLAGDIDRGGVFAQLLGTMLLLEEKEQDRVKGLIINKFRGDKTILDPGILMLEEKSGKPVVGVVPYMDISLEDEDSLTERFGKKEKCLIDIAVIRFPRISNFTDFDIFEQFEDVSLRYVQSVREMGNPDMILLPGSKNTCGDLKWMRQNGLEAAVKKAAGRCVVFGICGGYQMLGRTISDPYGVEEGGELAGMGLLPVNTVLQREKIRTQVTGRFQNLAGELECLSGSLFTGYEIHMGITGRLAGTEPMTGIKYESGDMDTDGHINQGERLTNTQQKEIRQCQLKPEGAFCENIYGTYVHGIFDRGQIALTIIKALAKRKGISYERGQEMDYAAFKETQYNKLADVLREYLDMDYIYGLMGFNERREVVLRRQSTPPKNN